jgi:hypothetical protein
VLFYAEDHEEEEEEEEEDMSQVDVSPSTEELTKKINSLLSSTVNLILISFVPLQNS